MLRGVIARFLDPMRRDPAVRAAAVRAALEAGAEHARAKRNAEAERCFLEALRLEPSNPDALNLLGLLAFDRTHYDAALDYFREALQGAAEIAFFHHHQGMALQALGRDSEAEAAFRRALALEPQTMRLNLSLLFQLSQQAGTAPEQLLAEHRACMARFLRDDPRRAIPPARLADPERRLRIGYLSGDFRMHAAAYFIAPLLGARDRNAFEVFCYQTLDEEDERTPQLRALADHWHKVSALNDDALADLIVEHEIDILVDLAGLTNGGRAHVIARKPAPVQVSYLGYLATTGIDALDYRVTDARADPPGAADRCHSERLIRLPKSFWCFAPLEEMPAPMPRDADSDRAIVFGSFNRLAKVKPAVLRLWGRLLARVLGSELWMADVTSDESHDRIVARFVEWGVEANRIKTWGRLPPQPYWDLIRRADIALDTFPYTGGATTCECLWLGVPVVTKAGAMGFARSGASILGNVGLPELVAESEEQYLEIAAALAADRPRLRGLQRGLRDRLAASPLLDAPGFMRDLEVAYRTMWREACRGSKQDTRAASPVPGC
jgi:predicted O-linked N-acetylglucosamine transferase (SPINDLY family)